MRTFRKLHGSQADLGVLEYCADRDGFLQRCPATLKLAFTLCFILMVVSVSRYDWQTLLPFFAYPLIALPLVGMPWRFFLQRLVLVFPFIFFLGLANVLSDQTVIHYGATVSLPGGVVSFAVLILKTLLTVGSALIFIACTPIYRVAGALATFRVPCLFVMQFLLTWRYLGVLTREAGNMAAAYHLRCGGSTRGIRLRHWAPLTAQFLIRCMDRAHKVHQAMVSRLFDARHIRYDAPPARFADWLLWLFLCLLCVFFRLLHWFCQVLLS
ncbi:MAG: cobalt ECF transporter T component CbiQ [Burkholderiaceae bacterium]|jgi:cobalt/nickel transport system permease protein|nr:cobalt ECF transporter T component CbiQ [Burkholderiaceae bacterium]